MFAYSGASVASTKPGEYILKVHGLSMSNILMQVESEKDLMQWNSWFNARIESSTDLTSSSYYRNERLQGETCLDPVEVKKSFDNDIHMKRISTNIKRLTRQVRLDSGITTHRLLDDNDDYERRGSDMTVTTLNSCYNQPVVISSEYGIDEINHARQLQQQRPEMANSASMMLGSITDEERRHTAHDPRVSFYSSFAGYLSNTELANVLDGSPNSESTMVAAPPLSNTSEDNSYHSINNNNHNFNHNSAGS